jgi:hypothetical protein
MSNEMQVVHQYAFGALGHSNAGSIMHAESPVAESLTVRRSWRVA